VRTHFAREMFGNVPEALLDQLRDQCSPLGPSWRFVVGAVPLDMTLPAKRHDAIQVVGIGTRPKGRLMMRFKTPGPAAGGASVAVTGEDGAADGSPAAGVQVGMIMAHAIPLVSVGQTVRTADEISRITDFGNHLGTARFEPRNGCGRYYQRNL